jgi:hypothetical protein
MALLKPNGYIITAVRDVQGRYILHEVRDKLKTEPAKIRQNDARFTTEHDRLIALRDRVNKARDRSRKIRELLSKDENLGY